MHITYLYGNNPNPTSTNQKGIEGLIKQIKRCPVKPAQELIRLKKSVVAAEGKDAKDAADAMYKNARAKCDGFMPGKWKYRNKDVTNCLAYEQLLVFDFDNIAYADVLSVLAAVKKIDYMHFAFPSIGWHGLRIGVLVENGDIARHRENYRFVGNMLSDHLKRPFDVTCVNPDRHFYFAYLKDEHIYYNSKSVVFVLPSEEELTIFNQESSEQTEADATPAPAPEPIVPKVEPAKSKTQPELLPKLDFLLNMMLNAKDDLRFKEGTRSKFAYRFFAKTCENGIFRQEAVSFFLQKFGDFDNGKVGLTAKDAYDATSFNSYVPKPAKPAKHTASIQANIKPADVTKPIKVPYLRKAVGASPYSQMVNHLLETCEFRRNIAKIQIEHRPIGSSKKWDFVKKNSIMSDLMESGYKNVSEMLDVFLGTDRFYAEYDPFVEYFENLPEHDGTDYIKAFCKFVETDNALDFELHLKKALCRCIAQTLGEIAFNKHAIVFQGKADDGKTSLVRHLNPFGPTYHIDKFEIEANPKDSERRLASMFFINLDELHLLDSKTLNKMKTIMTLNHVTLRFPYDKDDTPMRRRANFWGTTEVFDFLDNTFGNVRFITIKVKNIVHDNGDGAGYSQIPVDKIWTQAYHLYKTKGKKFYILTKEEIEKSENNNRRFAPESVEQELISKHFEKGLITDHEVQKMSATDILFFLEKQYKETNFKVKNVNVIGRAMRALGFETHGAGNGKYLVRQTEWAYSLLSTS